MEVAPSTAPHKFRRRKQSNQSGGGSVVGYKSLKQVSYGGAGRQKDHNLQSSSRPVVVVKTSHPQYLQPRLKSLWEDEQNSLADIKLEGQRIQTIETSRRSEMGSELEPSKEETTKMVI